MNTFTLVQKLWNYCNVLRNGRTDHGGQIVVTLSRQSSGAQFHELLPLKRPPQREFCAGM